MLEANSVSTNLNTLEEIKIAKNTIEDEIKQILAQITEIDRQLQYLGQNLDGSISNPKKKAIHYAIEMIKQKKDISIGVQYLFQRNVIGNDAQSIKTFICNYFKPNDAVVIKYMTQLRSEINFEVCKLLIGDLALSGILEFEALQLAIKKFPVNDECGQKIDSQKVEQFILALAGAYLDQNPNHQADLDAVSTFMYQILVVRDMEAKRTEDKHEKSALDSAMDSLSENYPMQYIQKNKQIIKQDLLRAAKAKPQTNFYKNLVDVEIIKFGFLKKKSNNDMTRKERFFVLTSQQFFYAENESASQLKGEILLKDFLIKIDNETDELVFTALPGKKITSVKDKEEIHQEFIKFSQEHKDLKELEDWLNKLKNVIKEKSQNEDMPLQNYYHHQPTFIPN